MIAEGTHQAMAVDGQFGESNDKGTPYVRVHFRVSTGESVYWTGYFTPRTEERTLESLRLCGCSFPNDDITNLSGLSSKAVSIVVEHEDFETKSGERKKFAKVKWVNELGAGSVVKKMADETLAFLKSRMKGAIVAARSKRADDADIPF